MKVYVVIWRESYEERDEHGIDTIWTTKDAALKYLEECDFFPKEGCHEEFWLDTLNTEYYIEEHVLNEE